MSQSPSQSPTHRKREHLSRALLHARQRPKTPNETDLQALLGSASKTKKIVHKPRHVDHLPKRRNRLRPCLSECRVVHIHCNRYLNWSATARRHSDGVRARRSRHRNDDVSDRELVERPFDRALAGAVQLPIGALAAEVAGEVEGKAGGGDRGLGGVHVDIVEHGGVECGDAKAHES